MLEYLLAVFVGILAGTFTGIFPGIHINLVSSLLIFNLPALAIFQPISLIIFIVSMSITHIFLDFVPSIYLGAPDDSGLSTMPGHSMLLDGKGHEAVCLTLYGALFGIFISILLSIPLAFALPKVYPFLEKMMGWLLIVASCFIIYQEKNSRLYAGIIFLLSGFLGLATFSLNISQPLLPLLSGLFGSSSLIHSISQKTKIPPQDLNFKVDENFSKPALSSSLISPICAFLPGIGGSQAAVISSGISNPTKKQFLFIVGSVNSIVMVLSFLAIYSINKARTGSAAAIQKILSISYQNLIIIFIITIIVSLIAFLIAIKTSKIFSRTINKINYSLISIIVLIILSVAVLIFSGFLGFLVFLASTILGLLAIEINIRKGNLIACLIVPTILYYLPF